MKKVLVVEDEATIQEVLSEILKSECGIDEVVFANDGLDGFHLAMSDKFDLITLDHMMPFCHGVEVLTALRSKEGPNKSTPILFISAFIPDLPSKSKETENTLFVEKPIDIARLIRYVKMNLSKSK